MPTKATELSSKTKNIRKYAKIVAIAGAGISAAALFLTLIPILLVGIVMTVVSTILFVVTKPKGQKATELPPRVQKMRRYTKSGLLIAVASSILQFFGNSFRLGEPSAPYAFPVLHENQLFLSVGILAGISIAFASTIARILMEPAPAELHTRKILGALLGYLSSVLLLFTLGSFGPIPPIVVFFIPLSWGIYSLRSKRNRLIVDIFWILPGLLLYALLPGTPATNLKGVLLTTDWSELSHRISTVGVLNIILMLGSAISLPISDILVHTKTLVESAKRKLVIVLILLIILAILFGVPLSRSVGVRMGPATGVSRGVGAPAFDIYSINASADWDSKNNLWIYQIAARNQLGEDAEIVEISAQKQPLGRFTIISEKLQLAPPFGEGIEVAGGEKTSEKIVVKPGYNVTLKIFSKDPLLSIALIERRVRYDISFWSIVI